MLAETFRCYIAGESIPQRLFHSIVCSDNSLIFAEGFGTQRDIEKPSATNKPHNMWENFSVLHRVPKMAQRNLHFFCLIQRILKVSRF